VEGRLPPDVMWWSEFKTPANREAERVSPVSLASARHAGGRGGKEEEVDRQ